MVISPLVSSGCNRNIEANAGSRSLYAMSRCKLSGNVFTTYLSIYGSVEQVTQITSNSGTAYGDYVFIMCLDREGSNNIPHIIKYPDQSMMVVVEGRRPLCWAFFQNLTSKNDDHHNNDYYYYCYNDFAYHHHYNDSDRKNHSTNNNRN